MEAAAAAVAEEAEAVAAAAEAVAAEAAEAVQAAPKDLAQAGRILPNQSSGEARQKRHLLRLSQSELAQPE